MILLICRIKKYNKPVNITKKKQTCIYRRWSSDYQWGAWGRDKKDSGRQWEVQTTENKKGYKDILYNTGYTANVL